MGRTIAWIDDDIAMMWPVTELLQDEGWDILRFESVKAVIDGIERIRIADVILLDMILPVGQDGDGMHEYGGKKVLQTLRDVYHVNTPVLVFSALPDKVIEDMTFGYQVERLAKPVLPSELYRAVMRISRNP